jgi:hypothetical protein
MRVFTPSLRCEHTKNKLNLVTWVKKANGWLLYLDIVAYLVKARIVKSAVSWC